MAREFNYHQFAEDMLLSHLAGVALDRAKQRAKMDGKTSHEDLVAIISGETAAIVDSITNLTTRT